MAALALAVPAMALEVITKEDIINNVVVEDQLVRVADNAVFLIDTSSSMDDEFQDRGVKKLELAIAAFKERNSYFPDIGHNFGIYQYTPWTVMYPMQPYDRAKVAAALDELPTDGSGPTPLANGIEEAEKIIKGLSGRTVLFLMYDGDYTGKDPNPALWRTIKENDACLVMISSASEEENERLRSSISRLNACSRLIPLEYYLDRPEYMAGALFDVRATENIVTTTEKRAVGVKVKPIQFDFDKTELTAADKAELDKLGDFMADKPGTYAVLAGYTDNIGVEDYNEHLSEMRAEMVAAYLTSAHGIDASRLVLHWHGSDNPVATNSTEEGRAQNRRVEVAVAGLVK
jgi:outer membrane protein OmpA-like peptidoglycan-associated protein